MVPSLSSFGDIMTFQICAICNQQEDADFIYTLNNGQEVCECCAIDAGEHKPEGLVINPPPRIIPEPVDWDTVDELY